MAEVHQNICQLYRTVNWTMVKVNSRNISAISDLQMDKVNSRNISAMLDRDMDLGKSKLNTCFSYIGLGGDQW